MIFPLSRCEQRCNYFGCASTFGVLTLSPSGKHSGVMLLGYMVDLLVSFLRHIHIGFHHGWTHSLRSWSCFYYQVKFYDMTLLPDWWIMSHHPLPPSSPGFKYERVEMREHSSQMSVDKNAESEQVVMTKSLLASGHIVQPIWGTGQTQ